MQVWPENILNNSDINKLNTIKASWISGISHHEFIQKHKDLLETTLKVGLTYYGERGLGHLLFIRQYWM